MPGTPASEPAPTDPVDRDPGARDPVVHVRGLRFAYAGEPAPVVDVPRLDIARAEHTAVVGPSGCGKTTLLHLLVGILRPDDGRITVAGRRVSDASDAERRRIRLRTVGMVFQSFALLDALSAIDNITLPVRMLGGAVTKGDRDRGAELASHLGLTARQLRRAPARLSQGERQRVAIARALILAPSVLVCDEPTGNLDRARADATIDLLFKSAEEEGTTLLVVTHDAAPLARFSRVIELEHLHDAAPEHQSGAGGAP